MVSKDSIRKVGSSQSREECADLEKGDLEEAFSYQAGAGEDRE